MECGVQRALARVEAFAGDLSNAVRDAPPVVRAERQNLQNQQVERPLEEVGLGQRALS